MSIRTAKRFASVAPVLPLIVLAGCNQSPSITPVNPYPNYTLTVNTLNPATGVPISVSYADQTGATSGTATFTRTYSAGATIVLSAPPAAGVNSFGSWTGCNSVSTVNCTVSLQGNTTVTATYLNPPNYTLTVNSSSPSSGVPITVSPADTNAATNGTSSFTRSYVTGTTVTLIAPASSGSNTFGSWTGCTSVTGTSCSVLLTSSRTITANYVLPTLSLSLNSVNAPAGLTVTASPADNNGKTALSPGGSQSYYTGTAVTLAASAASGGQVFQSWNGCASVTAAVSCTVIVSSPQTVTASYYPVNSGKTYYVSPIGSDSNDGLTMGTALLTLQHAADISAAGDATYAMTGTYTKPNPSSVVLTFNNAGTAAAPIAFRAYPGNTPLISGYKPVFIGNSSAYVEINGFTLNGNNQNVTFAQVSATPDYLAGSANYPQYDGACVNADARVSATRPTHISILNNIIGNCGSGIGMSGADYVTISGNTVFNCAWYSASGTSAISLLGFYNTDTYTGYKNFVTGNKIYNNYELIPWYKSGTLSDGEGIIIDTFQNSAVTGGLPFTPYAGRTLIANNVLYNNGSSAILVFNSSHVDIVNNSTYGNVHTSGTTTYPVPTGRGELGLGGAADVNVFNNILYNYTGQNPFVQSSCAGCTVDNNLYFNGTNSAAVQPGPNDVYADPQYVSPANQDVTKVNLSVVNGSPAIDTGTTRLAPAVDFNGKPRPQGKGYDRGAFEQ